ncbi:MAG: 3'-5' exonuclease [Mucinivorans sp.]
MFLSTISPQELSLLPTPHFDGEILVVDSPQTMAQAEQILQGEPLLGFDTETRPAFARGVSYRMSLLQISTPRVAILFRLLLCPLSAGVVRVLSDKRVLKIGAAINDDIKGLQKQVPFEPGGFVDLQKIVARWGIQDKSVKKMGAIVLEIKISKAQRLSNWEAARLTPAQQEYAAMDAWVCQKIYQVLMATAPLTK